MSVSRSVPPPRFGAHLRRAAVVSRVLAELLVTATSVRFAIGALENALGSSQSNFVEHPAPHPAGAGSSRPAPARDGLDPARARAASASAAAPASGRPVRLTLGVSAGEPRSEVYVNGRRVGQTPFLGDTSCKEGLVVRIEIVPPHDAPMTYLRQCRGGTLEISGPPP